MENFRTEFLPKPSKIKISHATPILTIGSCFTENIGNLLGERKFSLLSNPYGILFNPISIASALNDIVNKRFFEENDLIEHNHIFHSFWHHSQFSGIDKEKVLNNINQNIENTHHFIKHAKFLFVTLGTAWTYKYVGENSRFENLTVANCHKIPAADFEKELITIERIVDDFIKAIRAIKSLNPGIEMVFTLSPVRHLKDGFEENQISKSVLRLAINELIQTSEQVSYFPAYELVMDDLRDYRFFEEDMVHPNRLAINYVWKKFEEYFFSSKTREQVSKIEQFNSALNHKPFHPESEAHKIFCEKLQVKIQQFEKQTGIKI